MVGGDVQLGRKNKNKTFEKKTAPHSVTQQPKKNKRKTGFRHKTSR